MLDNFSVDEPFCEEPVLFESQITYTKAVMKEFFRTWFFKSKLWVVFFLPILIAVSSFLTRTESLRNTILICGILLEAITLSLFFFQYNLYSRRNYKRICEQNSGKEVTNVLRFFNSCAIFTDTATGSESKYYYSATKRIMESKNLIILTNTTGAFVAIEKSKFTIGKACGLAAFLKSKKFSRNMSTGKRMP